MKLCHILIALSIVAALPAQASDLRITDGDTIKLHHQTIRLAGIDAPEVAQTCTANHRAWNCGKASKANLSRIIAKRPLECQESGTDRYGRTLATCYARSANGKLTNINQRMVARGWAVNYYGYSYQNDERAAENKKRGVWRGEFMKPWEWRHKANS
jgi:endonuclease YncB( thermonuclease family)